MSKLRVSSFAVSLDGFGAGPNQDLQNPLGVGGVALMEWFFPTRTWRHMQGMDGGETGIDDQMAAQGMEGLGAWISAARPVLMGSGEALFAGLDLPRLGYDPARHVAGERATHVFLRKTRTSSTSA